MSLRSLRPQKHPQISLQSRRSQTHDKGLSLTSTWNQDAAGAQPWCQWAASLLLDQSQKLAIMKQWFELAVECLAFQFHWQWRQCLVECKLVLALSLDPLPGEWNSVRVVASCREAQHPSNRVLFYTPYVSPVVAARIKLEIHMTLWLVLSRVQRLYSAGSSSPGQDHGESALTLQKQCFVSVLQVWSSKQTNYAAIYTHSLTTTNCNIYTPV